MDPLYATLDILGSGMRAQSERLKVISQNLANKDTAATSPDVDPYRRQLVHFENYFDRDAQANKVRGGKPYQRRPKGFYIALRAQSSGRRWQRLCEICQCNGAD